MSLKVKRDGHTLKIYLPLERPRPKAEKQSWWLARTVSKPLKLMTKAATLLWLQMHSFIQARKHMEIDERCEIAIIAMNADFGA